MTLIDLSQRIEPHWAWDSFPLVSQAYDDGDEFQEFGLKWSGRGFTYASSPGWRISEAPTLDDLPIDIFAGVADVIDLSGPAAGGYISAGALTEAIAMRDLPQFAIVRSGHGDAVPMRRREYWTQAPTLAPAIAEMLAERGVRHVCLDLSCDPIAGLRPDGTGGIANPNEAFRKRAHALGLVVTENLTGLVRLPDKVFVFALPLRGQGLTTAPSRPVAMTEWPADNPYGARCINPADESLALAA